MAISQAYGTGTRMLTISELCEWMNITERHARKLVERNAIPYRKVGRLLRFPEAEIEAWSQPEQPPTPQITGTTATIQRPSQKRRTTRSILPKTLIE